MTGEAMDRLRACLGIVWGEWESARYREATVGMDCEELEDALEEMTRILGVDATCPRRFQEGARG